MTKPNDWNPDLYLKYKNERTQPSIDLVSRINIEKPRSVIDIGCGPGNSTQVLAERWPEAKTTGFDSSPAMIEKAKSDYPHMQWIQGDASAIATDTKYDIVFSNATIQWIPDHEQLIPRFLGLVEKGGALAVQIPKFRDMPMGMIVGRVAAKGRWKNRTVECEKLFTYHDYGFYYDILSEQARSVDMWETSYIHVMESHEAVLDWIRSTGLRPYLDRLEGETDKKHFENDVLEEMEKNYPLQKNGRVLFPFKRLFFIAYI